MHRNINFVLFIWFNTTSMCQIYVPHVTDHKAYVLYALTCNNKSFLVGSLRSEQKARQSSSRCPCTHILPGRGGGYWAYFFALQAAVSKIRAHFQNCHIWAWKLASGQSSRSCTCTLILPQWGEIELIFALRAAVSKILAHFQNCHIWAWNLTSGQSSRTCAYTLFLAQRSIKHMHK